MPRKKRQRRLLAPPTIKGLSVFGSKKRSEQILLFFEEYESIKLLDYDGMTQEEAAAVMGVSRPTMTRVYEAARNKVARAMVEGKDLLIRGGNFFFDDNWYSCKSCKAKFNLTEDSDHKCPVCGSEDIVTLNELYAESV